MTRPADLANDIKNLIDALFTGESIEHMTFPALEEPVWSPPQPFNDARGVGFSIENVETRQRLEVIVREVA